jgi:hypothetical protein
MVSDLAVELRSQKATPELTELIHELEQLLAADDADQNAIAKLVAAVAKSYIMPMDLMGVMGEALKGNRAKDYKTLALDCLEEGCPVDMVSDLVTKLQNETNPDPELAQVTQELEQLLSTDDADQNVIAEVVAQVAKNQTASNGLLHVLGSGINGARDANVNDYRDLAVDCLEEGCPVDMISELVSQLKAYENPDPELAQLIQDLEEALMSDDADQNSLAKLVAAVAKNYTTPNELMSMMAAEKVAVRRD